MEILLLILVILWFFGYIHIPWLIIPKVTLFIVNGRAISLYDVLIFILVIWALGLLPDTLRKIAGVLLILWLLSTFGLIVIAGFSQVILIAIIVGLGLSLLK